MSRELRAYRLTERIMKYSKGSADYEAVLQKARDYVKNNPVRLFSHVGDDYAAKCIASSIIGKELY